MPNKLFLIDAYALIYRSYYAFINSPRINSKGLNTSAILGFCNTLHEVMQKERPTHIAVAFDKGRTFRHEAFADYKAQREETPEAIKSSVPYIMDILRAYRIPILTADGFEADDIIGTVAHRLSGSETTVYMLTPDKDYAQLVAPNVFLYRPRHGGGYDVMGPEEVTEKYGLESASQVIDMLGLMGDASDNYPGCPGVGEKTAVKLIKEYGSIDALLANTDRLKGKMREKVESSVDDIRLSRFLATIRTDVPIDITLDAMALQSPDEERLATLFTELELKQLADRTLSKSKQTQKKVNPQPTLFDNLPDDDEDLPEKREQTSFDATRQHYVLVENEEDMQKLCNRLATASEFAFDTETTTTSAIDAELVGLSFSLEENEAFYVPVGPERSVAQHIVDLFRPAYESTTAVKVAQNAKYDITVLANYGIRVCPPLWDTMVAHYLINPELRHNMDYMAETLLSYTTIHIDTLIGAKGRTQLSMRDIEPAKVKDYAAEDADITLRLKHVLEPLLAKKGASRLFYEVEMPLVPVLVEMERNGVRIDSEALQGVRAALEERILLIEKEIYTLAGEPFNIASPRQVGDVLFGKLQITDKPKKTKTGQYVTSEEVLQQLSHHNPIVEKILQHRALKKLLGTYVDALPKLVNPRTGHIHTSFNQCVTATGRLSSSNPNLQNIPVRSDDGKIIRRCFIPEDGDDFFSADYSQVELRIMASLSGDENMIEAFRSGYDIHAATSAKINHKAIADVTKDERRKAKSANFGIIYGISAFGLSQQLDIPRSEAKELIDGYFQSFPRVMAYIEKAKDDARRKGYAETLMGRRRYLPDINSRNATVRSFAERNAVNAPIQGTAADIIKVAMIRIHDRFKAEGLRSRMILQVHDELNFSVPRDEHDRVERIVTEEMQRAATLAVPLIADGGWGKNWLEAH